MKKEYGIKEDMPFINIQIKWHPGWIELEYDDGDGQYTKKDIVWVIGRAVSLFYDDVDGE